MDCHLGNHGLLEVNKTKDEIAQAYSHTQKQMKNV
jgi:hypothetical protein